MLSLAVRPAEPLAALPASTAASHEPSATNKIEPTEK